jgi:general secretion pathway protein E
MAMPLDRPAFEQSLAAHLVALGKLDESGVERAFRLRRGSDERFEQILSKLGIVHERDIARAMSEALGIPLASPGDFPDEPVFRRVSPKFLREARVLPIAETLDHIVLAVSDPLDQFPVQSLALLAGKPVEVKIATPSEIELAHERLYGEEKPASSAVTGNADAEALEDDEDVDRLRDLASEQPVIRLVNVLIAKGIEGRASDIHIEPFQNRLVVRYRIDGVLREGATPPLHLRAAIVSRIKIMAKLNIAERRLPQDGRIRLSIGGRDYDLRVATVPTLHGERVTMRILDRSSLIESFPALGFSEDALKRYLSLLDQPQGILLVTGPTGSGKTTTLYTSLARLNIPERNIFTVEDPIEYELEGVSQVQVKQKIDLTFAEILRTLLRHNPDVIMIGEMRDLETAQVAIQAALTGHLVLSTLHTNNAASSITRLLDMGVEDYLVTSTVNGVTAQRLVRRLCDACRIPRRVLPEFADRMGLSDLAGGKDIILYDAAGCELCHGGYRGQIALIEVLTMSDQIRRLVLAHAEAREIHRAAIDEGLTPMYQDGLNKALQGMTTIEEVLRVTRDV